MKQSLVYDTSVTRQQSPKVIVRLAAILAFGLYSSDVTRAYLLSSEKIMRDV